MFLALSTSKVIERLKELGFKRTTSKRFRRFERKNKGVEILEYHNLTELDLYARVDENYTNTDLDDLRSELKEAFKGFVVE